MSHEAEASLKVVKGANPATIRIRRFPAIIGRSSEASLRLGTTAVSRKHCEIYEDAGELLVRDLGSTNGTFLNKEKIEGSIQLASGDLLRVGTVTFLATVPQRPEPELSAEDSCIDLDEAEAAPDQSGAGERSSVGYQETPDGSFINIEEDDNDDDDVVDDKGEEELVAETPPAAPEEAAPAAKAAAPAEAAPVTKTAPAAPAKTPPAAAPEEPIAEDTGEANPLDGLVEADEEPIQADDDDALGDFLKGLP